MQIKRGQFWCILLLGSLFLIGSVQGAGINTISAGNTVFLGEQGLIISGAMGSDTRIGWWASGADIRSTSPSSSIDVASRLNSFTVSPSEFSGYLGNWYRLDSSGNADGIAFNVAAPQIDLRVEDTTIGIDSTNKWVPSGDDIQFVVSTNMVQISQRGAGNPVTFRVQSPLGGSFTSLVNNAGTLTSLVNYQVTTTPQSTGAIWGTANRDTYPPGTYTVWVESYVNSQSSNTPLYSSGKVSVLIQDQNPLISNQKYVTNPTTIATTVPTTRATTALPTTLPTVTSTTPTKQPTSLPTTVPTTTETSNPVTSVPISPSPTKTPGFESSLAGISLIIGIVVYCKRH
jgi:hypothetical protein